MSLSDWFHAGKKTSAASPATGKKYELVQNQQNNDVGVTLYRIRALKDFGKVKAGDLGGYIESEKNLSQEGNCWVTEYGQVFGNAQVYGDAVVGDSKEHYARARVYEDAQVGGNVRVFGGALVHGITKVHGHEKIDGELLCAPRTWKANFRIKHIYGLGDWR